MATPKTDVQPRFRKPISAAGFYRETATGLIIGACPFAESLGAPAAKGTTDVHAGFAGNDASNDFPGPFTDPDVPRNLRVDFAAAWDGGNVTVVGVDQFGAAVTEVFTASAGSTVVGTKIFAGVTSATKGAVGAAADAASIGTGDKLGLSVAAYGLSACSIAFFMVGPTPVIPILPLNTTMLVLSMALAGIGYALAWLPMIHLLIVHLQRAQGQGSAANAAIAGVASAATSMSLVMGSFLGGFLADSFGFCWATTLWALTFLMGFIVSQTENKALYDVH